MGILGFFKKISKEKEKDKIKTEELIQWLESRLKKKKEITEYEIALIKKRADEEKENLKKNMIILENAKLKNQNIPERMKQIMEGNRKIYIEKIEKLSEMMRFPKQADDVLIFYENFDIIMNSFSKGIAKGHNIMQEFFAKESGAISSNIVAFDKFIKEAKRVVDSSKLEQFGYLKREIEEVQKKIKRKENSGREIEIIRKKIADFENDVKAKERRLKDLNESDEIAQFKYLNYKKAELQEEMLNLEKELGQNFSNVEAGLKRYSNLNKDGFLSKNYLKNPINALLDDKELEIINLMSKIEKHLIQGTIELKDKKKEKVLLGVKELNKEYLETFLSKSGQISKEIDKLIEDIKKNKVTNEISALNEEIKKAYAGLESTKKEFDILIGELNKINPDLLKEKLRQSILDSLGEKIVVV